MLLNGEYDVYNFDAELKLCPPEILVDIGKDGVNDENRVRLKEYLDYLERQCKGIKQYIIESTDGENLETIANTISNKLEDILSELELIESLAVSSKDILSNIEVIRAMIISIIGE